MPHLTLTLRVSDADPSLLDPQDVADYLADAYDETAAVDPSAPGWDIEVLSAEWTD